MYTRKGCSELKRTKIKSMYCYRKALIIFEFIKLKMYHKISKGTTRRTEVEGINLKSVEAENQISTRISTSQPKKTKKNTPLNQSIFKKQQRKRKERSLQNLEVKKIIKTSLNTLMLPLNGMD